MQDMARVRKIVRTPTRRRKNYFLVDACFLANKYIPPAIAPSAHERARIEACLKWWHEMQTQRDAGTARSVERHSLA